MAAGKYTITIEQGATFTLDLTWEDSDGNAVDLTGYSARMQVRASKSATTTLLDIPTDTNTSITLGGTQGTIAIRIEDDVTEALDAPQTAFYDLELEAGDGTVTRLLEGGVTITEEVTR